MNGPEAQQYWATKLPLVSQLLKNQAMEWVLSESTPNRRRWVTKHITGHFAHGKDNNQQPHVPTVKWKLKTRVISYDVPSGQHQGTMENQYADIEPLDERSRHSYGNMHCDHDPPGAVGQ